MASSSNTPMSEIEQLNELRRKNIITTADFLAMANEVTKTDAQRLAEAEELEATRGAAASQALSDSSSELLVDEDGDQVLVNEPEVDMLDDEGKPPTPADFVNAADFVGNAADFVNSGRAFIEFQMLKKGCAKKFEKKNRWVMPDTLTRCNLPPAEETTTSPSPQGT